MDPKDFSEVSSGRVIKSVEGHWTFIPDPLPPRIELDRRLINLISEASTALGNLAGAGQRLPNPHLLIGPFLRREAVLSSRIEGTLATAQELLLFEAMPSEPPRSPDVREVANYVRALEYGLNRLEKLPVSLRLMREIHSALMKGVRGSDKMAGQFRSIQNFIAKPGAGIAEAKYVPPSPKEMMVALNEFEKYLHRPSEWPFIVELALIHYQFEAIHPFVDGNGRIGRLLISLLLCERKLLPQPLLYLSAYFERYRDRYYELLFRTSKDGAWQEWIGFFLEGVVEQSRDAIIRTTRMLKLLDEYREQMQKARSSALMLRLIDELFGYPAITVSRAAKLLGVTYRSAKAIVGKLIAAGILKEAEARKYNRVFVSPEIIHIIEADVL